MSEEESGGVQGLRAWAADVAERVKRLTPAMGARDVPPGAYDSSIAELSQLARLLDHDPALHSAVSIWLGGALAMRQSAGGGEPGDGERAERLLRDARDRGTALGAAATEEDRRWAALHLVSIITPIRSQQGGYGAVPDLSAIVDWLAQAGPAGMMAFATELEELTAEVLELPLPPEFLGELRRMRGVFSAPPGAEFTDLVTSSMPAGDPWTDHVRQMMDQMFDMAGGPTGGPTDASGLDNSWPKSPVPDADSKPDSSPEPAPTLRPDDIRRIAAGLDALNASSYGLDDVLKSGDPQAFNEILRRLNVVQKEPPPGLDPASALEALRALLLNSSSRVGGTIQDQSASRAHLEKIVSDLEHFEETIGQLPPGTEHPAVVGRTLSLYARVMDAGQAEDVLALRDLVDEAEALEKTVPEGHQYRFTVLAALGAAYGRLGAVTGDKEMILRALPYIEKGITGVRESGLPFADDMPHRYLPDFGLLRAGLSGDGTEALPEHVPPPAGASTDDLHSSALSLAVRYSLTHDRVDLDTLIDELERVREGVRNGRAPDIAADALWQLAMAYRERGVLNQDVKDFTALEAAKEALAALAADVLLQSGAEHGLLAARSGASRGVQAALWAGSQGRPNEAVAALELGRALVLHAASTSSDVPELLDEGGHHDLAQAWRSADAPQSPGAGADGVPGELLSTLRRQALEALGYRQEGGLLGTPTLSELADGVEESGADALVYLVPCEDGDAGLAIVVGPRLGAGLAVRSHLSGAESGPLERYLDATAARDAAARDGGRNNPSAEQAWEEALKTLCGWAYQVLGPVLADVDKRLEADGRPLRIVLVPCGRLGIVPWHAARYPDDAPHDYLCETDVISYAASGSQFLRTVKRAPRDPAAAPVLLADPTLDLTHAEVEVMALRDAFYRRARMCGGIFELPEEELVPGTPDDVLTFLADGASLLHMASHGSAGTRPTVSALHLAAPERGGDTPAEDGRPETGAEPGMLTVTRLLDRPHAQQAAKDGPLVVLSACQTDLSTRDHDEALTLTTAFLAGGARDAIGSRWTTNDSASALLMAVFHHYLTVDGLSPVDALRAAQRWMLDPRRENPGSLRSELLRQMERPDLDRIPLWAAFIHQGHPGRGEKPGRSQDGKAGEEGEMDE
ncbi:CHAT domain-containing protein [Streptomyces sp. NBC_01431]|uniref:CHAT domain-containing protein n=1 Tax=Streptomyces sp. NBC_01431 TaxID=2903863 RepID=UPI002E3130D8|nr:CHAT domain-containing protein [Streptomyces sp. NBC_01431]